jgi:uncharacterized protein (DUF2141 family)
MRYILVLLFFYNILIASAQSADCQIKIKFENLVSREGNLIIALFSSEKEFLEAPFRNRVMELSSANSDTVCFSDLPYGKYALAIIHDLDKNGELNTSIFGPPTEPYGFSNNALGFMSAPDFESASFEVKGDAMVIQSIRLR